MGRASDPDLEGFINCNAVHMQRVLVPGAPESIAFMVERLACGALKSGGPFMPGACVPPVLWLLSLDIHGMHGLGHMGRGVKWGRGAAGHQTQTEK